MQIFTVSKDKINFDSICPRSDDPEDDKEKKELGCLTIENGIAPNHGLAFFHCLLLFFCCSFNIFLFVFCCSLGTRHILL